MTSAVSAVPGPDDIAALHELQASIDQMLGLLTPREAWTVRLYYGFEGEGCTYDEVGRQLGVSGKRIAQILAKALRKLRHPARLRLLRQHVDGDERKKIEDAEKKMDSAEAKQLAEMQLRAEAWRAKNELRHRVGDEIVSAGSPSWWRDDRRKDLAEALDRVVNEDVTHVSSTEDIYRYLGDQFGSAWKIYEAWKRDVRRLIRDNYVSLTRASMADGSYLIYAQKDQCTWYLFETWRGFGRDEYRWIGYATPGIVTPRQGRMSALEQDLRLSIVRP